MKTSDNQFMKHVGPAPGDVPEYREPEGAKPLADADPATANAIRLQLAIRARQQSEGGAK